jgi:hypothetical protein
MNQDQFNPLANQNILNNNNKTWCNFWPLNETHSIIFSVTMNIILLQNLVSLLNIIPTYIKVKK